MARPRWALGLIGAATGGGAGFLVRGHLNSAEKIGFGNILEQLAKLAGWTSGGAALGATIGIIIARVLARRQSVQAAEPRVPPGRRPPAG